MKRIILALFVLTLFIPTFTLAITPSPTPAPSITTTGTGDITVAAGGKTRLVFRVPPGVSNMTVDITADNWDTPDILFNSGSLTNTANYQLTTTDGPLRMIIVDVKSAKLKTKPTGEGALSNKSDPQERTAYFLITNRSDVAFTISSMTMYIEVNDVCRYHAWVRNAALTTINNRDLIRQCRGSIPNVKSLY